LATPSLKSSIGNNGVPFDQQLISILQPLFAPGLLFNTIKACVAVDYPVIITGTNGLDYNEFSNIDNTNEGLYIPNAADYYTNVWGTNYESKYYTVNKNYNHRFKFTDLLDLENSIPKHYQTGSLYYLNPTFYGKDVVSGSDTNSLRIPHYSINHLFSDFNKNFQEKNSLYKLGINNFLAEIPKFFLKNEKLNNFLSKPQKDMLKIIPNKKYYMDVYISKDENFSTILTKRATILANDKGGGGDLFETSFYGPPSSFEDETYNAAPVYAREAAYAPFTPEYLYVKSVARISFSSSNDTVTLKDIIEKSSIEYLTTNLYDYFSNLSQDPDFSSKNAYTDAMKLSASVNFKQITKLQNLTYDQYGNPIDASEVSDGSLDVWSIQTIFETPALNFNNDLNKNNNNNQQLISDGTREIYLANTVGMWSGYGEIPQPGRGIRFGIERSFPDNETTGSLIDLCGFEVGQRDIGSVAAKKEISEGVILIPYVELGDENLLENEYAKNILGIVGENGITKSSRRNGPFYFSVDKNMINKLLDAQFDEAASVEQLKKIIKKPSIDQNNSIIRAIKGMTEYNLPPHLDWVNNKKVDPFVMYFFEFKHELTQQDLADIWQGLMPTIAKIPQLDMTSFEHQLNEKEFFHGKKLPAGMKFKIFKVKKKASKSYYELTDDSSDDARFRFKFANEKTTPDYSYNYPYDFFSLVELINVEAASKAEE
jgi:hypothetical protein